MVLSCSLIFMDYYILLKAGSQSPVFLQYSRWPRPYGTTVITGKELIPLTSFKVLFSYKNDHNLDTKIR